MLYQYTQTQLSLFEGIYYVVVPKDHLLRQMLELCDFSKIYDELKDKYCPDNGAGAISPVLLFKYLILKAMYHLSDVDVVERSKYDMSFKMFLGYRPEDEVIHPSTLSKFRTQRLKDVNILDLLLNESVNIAKANGIIKDEVDTIIDSMHIGARHNQKTPEMIIAELARNVRRSVYNSGDAEKWKKRFPAKADKKGLDALIQYCYQLIDIIKNDESLKFQAKVHENLNLLAEVLAEAEQPETEEHTYLTPMDPDASIGYKSAYNPFYGYKDHYLLTLNRIIIAAVFTAGHINDGGQLPLLVKKAQNNGLSIHSVIGDMAYASKQNLEFTDAEGIKLVGKLNPVISAAMLNQERDGFTYNKDARRFICPRGRMSEKGTESASKNNDSRRRSYRFDASGCVGCPLDGKCHKPGTKSRVYTVVIPSELNQKQQAFQESDEFKELMNHRYKIEAKNSELKYRYGLNKAESTRLIAMSLQGATAMFVANMKRIMTLIAQKEK
ncbi:IS1182 family transposase [uncultured Dialister sp.]|uniref:IS1182 family transposase n=1 Tax=uncultured Dialister sp. TaxID=278064 RepID=UPI0025D2B2D4|nr:IS1182 family transposase [uncultured Dialister sp.]